MFGRTKVEEKDGNGETVFTAVEIEEVAEGEQPAENGDAEESEATPVGAPVNPASEEEAAAGDGEGAAPGANGAAPARHGQTLGERLSDLRAQLQRTPSVVAEVDVTVRTGPGFAAIQDVLVPGARHLFLLQAAIGRTGDLRLQRDMEGLVTATIESHRRELDDERHRLDATNRAGGTRVQIRFTGERRMKVTMKAANAMQLVGIVEAIDSLATTIQVAAFSRTIDVQQQHQLEENLKQRSSRLVEHLRKLEVQALKGYNDQVRKEERSTRRRRPERTQAS